MAHCRIVAIVGQFNNTFQNFDLLILRYWRLFKSDDVFEQLIVAGAAGGIWAYGRHVQRTNIHLLALNHLKAQGILSSSPWWKQWFQDELFKCYIFCFTFVLMLYAKI